ncbi:S locus-related glycoprotein 1 binding pollen coat [Corchorus olitorius]|uniref:S locus-related glycoprotein 1 binding pollen coat n=1 Tax=Corchorus olitorius TaxID=93759 RepID=A0A1R3KL51_9ROSI|nr:S locus-related glycoprotein 1 binding pollen coat [Corchorus olitorius]
MMKNIQVSIAAIFMLLLLFAATGEEIAAQRCVETSSSPNCTNDICSKDCNQKHPGLVIGASCLLAQTCICTYSC